RAGGAGRLRAAVLPGDGPRRGGGNRRQAHRCLARALRCRRPRHGARRPYRLDLSRRTAGPDRSILAACGPAGALRPRAGAAADADPGMARPGAPYLRAYRRRGEAPDPAAVPRRSATAANRRSHSPCPSAGPHPLGANGRGIMKLDPSIAEVTERIRERSRESRREYLARLDEAAAARPRRTRLSCSNLAHGFAACPAADKAGLAGDVVPNLGIITAYNDMLSAHQPLEHFPEIIRQAAREAGGVAQVASGVPAM